MDFPLLVNCYYRPVEVQLILLLNPIAVAKCFGKEEETAYKTVLYKIVKYILNEHVFTLPRDVQWKKHAAWFNFHGRIWSLIRCFPLCRATVCTKSKLCISRPPQPYIQGWMVVFSSSRAQIRVRINSIEDNGAKPIQVKGE